MIIAAVSLIFCSIVDPPQEETTRHCENYILFALHRCHLPLFHIFMPIFQLMRTKMVTSRTPYCRAQHTLSKKFFAVIAHTFWFTVKTCRNIFPFSLANRSYRKRDIYSLVLFCLLIKEDKRSKGVYIL